MIASAASARPPSPSSAGDGRVDAVEQVLRGVGQADQPGGADHHVDGADAEPLGDPLGDGVGGLEALGAGVAVGAAGVEHDRADGAVLDDLLAPQDRVGLAPVGGEDAGGVVRRAVVDDEGEVLGAGGLQAGGDAGGAEAGGMGDGHGDRCAPGLLDGDGRVDGVPTSSPGLGGAVGVARAAPGSSRWRTSRG